MRNIYTHTRPRPSAPFPLQGVGAGRRGSTRALPHTERGPKGSRGNSSGRGRSPPPRRKTPPLPRAPTANPAGQHARSPCGSAELQARHTPPPLRPAAYPEVASCVRSPSGAGGRRPAPGSRAPSSPPPPPPPPGPPSVRPPARALSRPSPAAACACACARAPWPASPERLSSPARLPSPRVGSGVPPGRVCSAAAGARRRRRTGAHTGADTRRHGAPCGRSPPAGARPRARPAAPAPGPSPPHPPAPPGVLSPPFLCSSRYLHEDYLMTQQGSPQRDRRHFSVFILSLPCDRWGGGLEKGDRFKKKKNFRVS